MLVNNRTPFQHGITMGMDVAGRDYLSMVVKGTYGFPDDLHQVPVPCPQQSPLVMADEHTDTPGFSATKWETDYAFRKAKCDVVLQGAAYAPGGKPAEGVEVGLKVGQMAKSFRVVGAREWRVLGPAISATRPHPFTKMEFGFDTAFGGVCKLDPDDDKPPAYLLNHVGLGFAAMKNQSRLDGSPLPNTEELNTPVASPYGTYKPMSFGPISRVSAERAKYAGTYDQDWQDNVFPFLAKDFDERYYQQAGTDQQIDFPSGGTDVVLVNLTPRGKEAFYLPPTELPVRIFRGQETALNARPRPDTMLIDAEARMFSLVWRVEVPIRRLITEFTEFWIGAPTGGMIRAKASGKRYLGMAHLAQSEPETV